MNVLNDLQATTKIQIEAVCVLHSTHHGVADVYRKLVWVAASANALLQVQQAAVALKINTQGLTPSRFGKKLTASDTLVALDQIVWLRPVAVDANIARQARVAKQRQKTRAERQGRTSGAMKLT